MKSLDCGQSRFSSDRAFGLSNLRFRVYIVASAIFFLPGGFAIAFVGAEMGVVVNSAEKPEIFNSIAVVFLAFATLLIAYIVSKLIASRNKFASVDEIENRKN